MNPEEKAPRAAQDARPHQVTLPLPASPEAEKGVLCSFLIAPAIVGARCAEIGLLPEHFLGSRALIYAALAEMWASAKPIDTLTLLQRLHDAGQLEQCGGGAEISEIAGFLPTAALAESYLETLLEKQSLRVVIQECGKLIRRAYEEQDDVAGILSDLAGAAAKASGGAKRSTVRTMRELALAKVDRMSTKKNADDILLTGIAKLDCESPIRLGSMPLICGKQKHGKSIFALSIASHIAAAGQRVLYFSLEDPVDESFDRLTANVSRVPIVRHNAEMSETDTQDITRALTRLMDYPFTLRDDVHDLGAISAVIEQHKAQHPDLALVVIDYAQLVRVPSRKQDTREMEVAKISRTFRLLSIRLKVALLLLSQVNDDGRSRESSALEQDCTAKWQIEQTDESGVRWIKIPIQRNGSSQIQFPVTFLGHIARVENCRKEPEVEKSTKKGARWNGGRD